jgi:hypothetical protein
MANRYTSKSLFRDDLKATHSLQWKERHDQLEARTGLRTLIDHRHQGTLLIIMLAAVNIGDICQPKAARSNRSWCEVYRGRGAYSGTSDHVFKCLVVDVSSAELLHRI